MAALRSRCGHYGRPM